MNRFLRHVLPRIFENSTVSKSNEPTGGRQRSDNTHRWSRKHYEQFPEPLELQVVPGGLSKVEIKSTVVVTSKGDVDNQSETAILEIKPSTVSSESHDSPSHSFEDERGD